MMSRSIETLKRQVKVLETELPERLPEIFFGDYVVLRGDLPEERKLYYLAHALGLDFGQILALPLTNN
jgi:hypothetical protein